MTTLPLKQRSEMAADPEYSRCALQGLHECGGRVSWEHAMYYAGKKIQDRWAVIPICSLGHGVDQYQDMASVSKEVRQWIALNRATDAELAQYNRAVPSFFFQRDRLNTKYGEYIAPPVPETASMPVKSPLRDVRKPVSTRGPESELDREARRFGRENGLSFDAARIYLTNLV